MSLFRKPTLADVYLHELRTQLDATLVPVFTPDTRVEVGTIGRFEKGRFDVVGHLREVTSAPYPTESTDESDWVFASEGHAHIETTGTVPNPLGGDLVKGTLKLSGKRAAVASFKDVRQTTVASVRTFDDLLWKLYLEEALAVDDVVVWSVRSATSGTVVVNRSGDISVEVAADPKVIGALLSFAGLGAGVTFGGGDQASFQFSGTTLCPFVRTKGTTGRDASRIVEVRRFSGSLDDKAAQFEGAPVPEVTIGSVLEAVDFDADD